MKLKDSFVTHKSNDDYMMIDASGKFSGLVRSNATAAFIVECLKTDTTKEEIVAKMLDAYEVSEREATEGADKIINSLKGIGAIEE